MSTSGWLFRAGGRPLLVQEVQEAVLQGAALYLQPILGAPGDEQQHGVAGRVQSAADVPAEPAVFEAT